MKQPPSIPLPSLLRSCVLGLALAATPALAQEPPPPLPTPAAVLDLEPTVIAELNLQEMTLGDAAKVLADRTGENVLVSDEVKTFPVPAMQLRNVTGIGILRAIASSGVPIVVSETPGLTAGEASVWVISPAATAEPVANQTKVFNLSSVYIESVTPADTAQAQAPEVLERVAKVIMDAVQETLATRAAATQGKSGSTVMKVHQATRLMIVSGKPEDVDIARQVICALGGKSVE